MKTTTDKKYTDQELYLLVLQKNKAGFAELYAQYGCIIYGLAIKAVRSKECADEVVELTFIKAWNSIHLFKHQQKTLCAWLICIFITTVKEYLESKNIKFNFKAECFPDFAFEIFGEKACQK